MRWITTIQENGPIKVKADINKDLRIPAGQ